MTQQARRFLGLPDVKHQVGLYRTTIYEKIKAGDFPRPYSLSASGRAIAWASDEIQAWIPEGRTTAPVFFIERSLGRYKVAQALRDTGELVEVHDDHLPADAPDEEWIKLVAGNGWLAITKDKNIRYRQHENDAINRYGAKVFVIRAKNLAAKDTASILTKAAVKMKRYAKENRPPFIVAVYRDGSLKPYSSN